MMRLLLLILVTMSSSAFAAEAPPSFFTPHDTDVSMYYLGAIFGNQLIPGGADMHLVATLFKIFNTVVLNVALIIIVYTIIAGVLQTAGKGKPLGEKWNAVWMPIRMTLGIALLVPKAGSGYCMAQYLSMWLVIQGIGAADRLWDETLDYFIEGGAIYSESTEKGTSYMTVANLNATYDIEEYLLRFATCLEAHNNSTGSELYGKYKVYSTDDYLYLNFGNEDAWENGTGGQECGYAVMPGADTGPDYLYWQTYNNGLYAMARSLSDPADFLAGEEGNDYLQWPDHFTNIQMYAVTYIEHIHAAQAYLNPPEAASGETRQDLEKLKKYGWIMAGNYYMTLSSFEEKGKNAPITFTLDTLNTIGDIGDEAAEAYKDQIQNAKDFWKTDQVPQHDFTYTQWANYHVVPGYTELESGQSDDPNSYYRLSKSNVEDIQTNVKQLGTMIHTGTGGSMDPLFYVDKLTGYGEAGVSQDPILHAAKYGGMLTDTAVSMALTFIGVSVGILAIAAFGIWGCNLASILVPTLTVVIFMAPIIFGLAGFLYAQGVMLAVYLPLVIYVTFLVGVLGWFMAVIESIVAAPLVAVGLIFPETQQEIWGRAEPAYMMILNLFLRPPLMIMGFVIGMIFAWIAIDLLNAAYYLFIIDGAQIENAMFGYVVTTMVYAVLITAVVTKAFSLINDLPNKTLAWIGDRTAHQEGAGEMLNAAKGGAERAGQAAAGGMGAMQQGVTQAAKMLRPAPGTPAGQEGAAMTAAATAIAAWLHGKTGGRMGRAP